MVSNDVVAARLMLIAQLMDLLGEDRFRVIAHERAARAVEGLAGDVSQIACDRAALLAIPGIGPKIADKIIECCTTGRIAELETLGARVPAGVVELMSIPGIGPKTAGRLWSEGGVQCVADLERIIADGSILKLARMGAKAVEKIKGAIAQAREGAARMRIGVAMPIAERFRDRLAAVPGVKQAAYAGSLRRGRETIGDIDILVATGDPAGAAGAFRADPAVVEVVAAGDVRSSVRAHVESATGPGRVVQVDLRAVEPAAWGAALMYFTGSKEHNVRLRERALKMGMTLSEYGLFRLGTKGGDDTPRLRGEKPVAGATEEEVYAALGLPMIPPELREGGDELNLRDTPRLIELADIKAELHAHTRASDGSMTIDQLAAAARARGFHTVAVTDHSQSSVIAGGLKPDALRRHVDEVHAARERIKGITVLAGSEVDILADGRLDYDDEVLALLDVVIASPHAALSQDSAAATARLLRAVTHPLVHIIGHPTGRLIERRRGLEIDIQTIAAAAAEHGTALEVNANSHRLDLRDTHVRAAVDAGCLVAINCDVHWPADFGELRYGVLTARRGWLTADRCVNTWSPKKLRAWLTDKAGKSRHEPARPPSRRRHQ